MTIEDSDALLRRIMSYYVKDSRAISSAAFKLKKNETALSVDIARLTTVAECLSRGLPGQRICEVKASIVRGLGCNVTHEPEPLNHAHALITGDLNQNVREQMAAASQISLGS